MSLQLADCHHVALAEITAGRITYDRTAQYDYCRDGTPLDFWEAAPFDELIVGGYARRDGSGNPLAVTR